VKHGVDPAFREFCGAYPDEKAAPRFRKGFDYVERHVN
jgi:hypothetical protein